MTYYVCEVIRRTQSPLTYNAALAVASRAGLCPSRCSFQRLELSDGITWQILYASLLVDDRMAAYEQAQSLAQTIKQKGSRVGGLGPVVVTRVLQPLGGLPDE